MVGSCCRWLEQRKEGRKDGWRAKGDPGKGGGVKERTRLWHRFASCACLRRYRHAGPIYQLYLALSLAHSITLCTSHYSFLLPDRTSSSASSARIVAVLPSFLLPTAGLTEPAGGSVRQLPVAGADSVDSAPVLSAPLRKANGPETSARDR